MAAYLKKTASAEMRSTQYRQTGHRRRRRVLLLPVLLGLMLFLGGFLLGAARAVVEEPAEQPVEQTVEALPLSPASTAEAQRFCRHPRPKPSRWRARHPRRRMSGSCGWSSARAPAAGGF